MARSKEGGYTLQAPEAFRAQQLYEFAIDFFLKNFEHIFSSRSAVNTPGP